ncbi:MAG: hypothetical protein J7513_14155 [Solirubrobacteraceae bacterium]|nr:hypothetical protein [Solirubrobacteraceae bacterium]
MRKPTDAEVRLARWQGRSDPPGADGSRHDPDRWRTPTKRFELAVNRWIVLVPVAPLVIAVLVAGQVMRHTEAIDEAAFLLGGLAATFGVFGLIGLVMVLFGGQLIIDPKRRTLRRRWFLRGRDGDEWSVDDVTNVWIGHGGALADLRIELGDAVVRITAQREAGIALLVWLRGETPSGRPAEDLSAGTY